MLLSCGGSTAYPPAPRELSLLAGATSEGGRGNADGVGTAARMSTPLAVVMDNQDRPVVLDKYNARLRRLDADGTLRTIAQLPTAAVPTPDGRGLINYDEWRSLARGPDGSLYVAASQARFFRTETGNYDNVGQSWVVLRIGADGAWQVFLDPLGLDPGAVPFGKSISAMVFDAQGRLLLADRSQCVVRRLDGPGRLSIALNAYPGPDTHCGPFENLAHGIVWMALDSNQGLAIGKANGATLFLAADGSLRNLPATGGTTLGSAAAFDGQGRLWRVDVGQHTLRMLTPTGELQTVAGVAAQSGSDDGLGGAARFNEPAGLAVSSAGSVFVADSANHSLRQVSPAGEVRTVAGLAPQAGYRDGPGAQARFAFISDIGADAAGNAYVADASNFVLRKIDRNGVVSTIAGKAGDGFRVVDGRPEVARLEWPQSLAVMPDGSIWVNEILAGLRLVQPNGAMSSGAKSQGSGLPTAMTAAADGSLWIATGDTGFSFDRNDSFTYFHVLRQPANGPAERVLDSAAAFWTALGFSPKVRTVPQGLAIGRDGALLFTLGHAVLRRTRDGVVEVVAGALGEAGSTDGPAAQARLQAPTGLAADASGNLYVADTGNHTVRLITPDGQVSTVLGRAGQRGLVLGAMPAGLDNPQRLAVTPAGLLVSQKLGVLLARW